MSLGIVVIGARGHAKVVIEILREMGERVDVCVGADDSPNECIGVKVLKGDGNLRRLRAEGYERAFIAIGANPIRERLAGVAAGVGFELVSAVHPRAVVSPTAQLGRGVAVMAGVVVNAESLIEDLAIINTGSTVDHDCRIGRAAHVSPQCALAGGVVVGAGTFLGVGCKVIPGVRIGNYATIGAGAVVVSDIANGVTAMGVPARPATPASRS